MIINFCNSWIAFYTSKLWKFFSRSQLNLPLEAIAANDQIAI